MAQPQSKSSPLNELCSALPSLSMRLREVGRFVAANDYDATTCSMRDLATAAGADPASFTRLTKALGYSRWDALRAALTEAGRRAQPSPFSGRTKRRRQGPDSDVMLVAGKLEAEAAGLARISSGAVAGASKALHAAQRIWTAGFRSCRSVAELLSYQLRLFRPDSVQLVGVSGPEDLDLGAFRGGDAVIVTGFAPYSTASISPPRGDVTLCC
jgi:DNA-binding MurR/RpiR family transcriptional regulator